MSRGWRSCRAWLSLRRVLAAGLAVGIVLATVAGLSRLTTGTGPESFVPADDRSLELLDEAASSFGGDPIVVIAESDGPRELLSAGQLPVLMRLEGALADLDDVSVVYGPATILNQIAASAQNMLASLSGNRDALRQDAREEALSEGLSENAAAERAEEAVAEFDNRYGGLLVQGLPAGLPTVHNPDFVEQVIFGDGDTPKPRWDFVVPREDAVSILVRPREGLDQAGTEELLRRVRAEVDAAELATERVTVTGVPAVTGGLGERIRREVPLLGAAAILAIGASYLLVPWLPSRRRRLVPIAVTLSATAMVLAGFGWLDRPLSLGVIAFLPILVGIASDFPAYLERRTDRRRAVVVALASAAAFGSLAATPLPFVRELGVALAAGQLVALALALAIQRTRSARRGRSAVAGAAGSVDAAARDERGAVGDDGSAGVPVSGNTGSGKAGSRLGLPLRVSVFVLLAVLAAAGWSALRPLDVEARPDALAEGLPAMEHAGHAEEVLGASGEVQVLVRGDNVLDPDVLAWMRAAQDAIVVQHGGELTPILTPPGLLEFLGREPTAEQVRSGMRLMPEYLTRAVVRSDERFAAMSFQLGLQDLATQQELLEDVRAGIPEPPEGVEADLVGLPVTAARAYELMTDNRYVTNGLGVLGAGVVLLVGLRRRGDAIRAVAAAMLATGWGLAGLWALDIGMTPLTMVLGSLTTAVACEYTVMLGDRTGNGTRSLARTVAVAALSASLGYFALTLSGLAVLREFGVVLAGAVVLSFVAAHVVRGLFTGRRRQDSRLAGASRTRAERVRV